MVNTGSRALARPTLEAALEAAYRETLSALPASGLVARALELTPPPPGPIRLLALGKSAGPMMDAALAALGPRARDPLCILPAGETAPDGVRALHGNHPRPGLGSRVAGEAVAAWGASRDDTPSLVLLSGGGSALAVAPADGIPADDKVAAIALLMRAGLPIHELNAVRKHLSRIKGGRLAVALSPAPVRVLVLSDVPGDDLSTVASGPLVGDATTWPDVARIVDASGVGSALPDSIRRAVAGGLGGALEESPKPGDPRLDCASHQILAGPETLARVAAESARRRGMPSEHDPRPLTGTVQSVADRIGAWVREHAGHGPRLLALGGEPTIAVPPGAPDADGGRAQHLALLAARALSGIPAAAVLAAGSDGRDGPTAQAGAVVTGETARFARWNGIDLDEALASYRSGPACVAIGAALPSFWTGTHLGDLVLIAVS
jgi:hydroxypyruvate reductase